MTDEEKIRCLDAVLVCIDRYKTSGSFEQAVRLEGASIILIEVREAIALGTPWANKFSTMAEMTRPPASEVAEKIIRDLNND